MLFFFTKSFAHQALWTVTWDPSNFFTTFVCIHLQRLLIGGLLLDLLNLLASNLLHVQELGALLPCLWLWVSFLDRHFVAHTL